MARRLPSRKGGAHLSVATEAVDEPKLIPLTPQYDEVSHKVYVESLNDALKDEQLHNIALSGHYGVGKSSILRQVADDNKALGIITISLSSLRVDSKGSLASNTNQIQKEIVKQLLYREAPSSMPDSRYKRLARYDWKKGLLPVAIVTLFLYMAIHIAGLTVKLLPFPDATAWYLVAQFVGLYVLLSFLLLYLNATTFNRIWIDKVTTGSTTLSLTKPADTYFDEFLDELVYFFEISETRVIIFEDLDRFNDPTIFENLRALNSLLNNSKQLKGRSIRFIYAIRDSIFESVVDSNGGQSASRSNRTKFFDVVVPVVPFITHSNARDLMTSVMGDVKHSVPPTLVRIAARHVTDMRVLKNVRNEFLIFRERIFGPGDREEGLGLTDDKLYAMILYKNTHLGDFERISTAESDLDVLYRASRSVVNSEIDRLTAQEAEVNRRVASLNSIGTRSQDLGAKLGKALDCVQGRITAPYTQMIGRTVTLNGSTVDEDGLRLESTWTALMTQSANLVVTFNNQSGQRVAMEFGSNDLEILLGEALSPDTWQKEDGTKLEEQIRSLRREVDAMRKADIAELVRLNPRMPATSANGAEQGFKDFVRGCLKSEMALELATGGFIDRNFTLYTSVYHGIHVSVSAKNFLMKCIEQQIMDPEFTLDRGDVEAVLNEVSEDSLSLRGAYNVNLLDLLLESGDPRGGGLIKSLAQLGDDERKFLGSYWIRGKQQLRLAHELGRLTPDILTYLTSDHTVPEILSVPASGDEKRMSEGAPLSRVHLIDQALRGLNSSIKYRVDASVATFLSTQVKKLKVLTEPLPDDYSPEPLLAVITGAEVKFDNLSDISASIRDEVIRLWAFKLTRSNVRLAVPREFGISLDAIRMAHEDVYDYVLSNLSSFIAVLTEKDATISEQAKDEDSVAVLNDVVREAPQELAAVLDRAASGWRVLEIGNIDVKAWGELARRSLFTASYHNVRLYRDQIGIDESIAMLLVAAQRFESRDQTEDEGLESSVVALAQELVLAKKVIPDPYTRVVLADSLQIKTYLELPSPLEPGTLAGLMIESDLIDDSLETFQLLVNASADWATLEFAISKSKKYTEFVTTEILQPPVAQQLLESTSISDDVKRVVVDRSAEFLNSNSHKAQSSLAREAARLSMPLSADRVLAMATAGVSADLVMPFLTPQLSSLDLAALSSILTALGGDYSKIATRSYSRPKFRKGRHIEALVRRLSELGVVSSVDDKGEAIRVNMRHP